MSCSSRCQYKTPLILRAYNPTSKSGRKNKEKAKDNSPLKHPPSAPGAGEGGAGGRASHELCLRIFYGLCLLRIQD